jgi:hypothetical protein
MDATISSKDLAAKSVLRPTKQIAPPSAISTFAALSFVNWARSRNGVSSSSGSSSRDASRTPRIQTAEFERLRALGVRFTQEPVDMGPVTTAVLDDTCGNLIQIAQQA